jgi:hypothetical protein
MKNSKQPLCSFGSSNRPRGAEPFERYNADADAMSDGRSENSEEDDDLLVPMPSEVAQQLQILDASVWADGIKGQPDRKKGKSDGRLTSRFVWTEEVSAVV